MNIEALLSKKIGSTALHYYVGHGNKKAFKILVKNGADFTLRNIYGAKAYSVSSGHEPKIFCAKFMKPRIRAVNNCRDAVIQLLLIYKYRTTDLRIINHDMIRLIGQQIWNSRFNPDIWTFTNQPKIKKLKI